MPFSLALKINNLGPFFLDNGAPGKFLTPKGLVCRNSRAYRGPMFERFDLGELFSPVKDPETGYLKIDAWITKVGVFVYHDDNGEERRELRHPDEVFRDDALASFGLVPFTNEHPGEPLNSINTGRFQRGSVSGARKDSDNVHMIASVQITDVDTITAAEDGKRELSCGYKCDLEFRAGVTKDIPGVPDGLKFDAVQKSIRGNHVALVDRGRAGGSVALRFDHGAEVTKPNTPKRDRKMETIRIDGVDYEVSAQAAQAYRSAFDKKDQEILTEKGRANTAEEKVQTETARADAAEEKVTKLEANVDASPEAIHKAVHARVALIEDARKVVGEKDKDGKEIKLDDKTDAEIRAFVVKHASPDLAEDKFEQETYIQARFDAAVEDAEKSAKGDKGDDRPNAGLARLREAAHRTDGDTDPVEAARQKNLQVSQGAWKVSPRADKNAAAA